MNAAIMLSIDEVADLESLSYDAVRKKINRNNLQAVKIETNSRRGYEYRIALEELSDLAQKKYYSRIKNTSSAELLNQSNANQNNVNSEEASNSKITIESLTEEQRKQVQLWKGIIEAYRKMVSSQKNKKVELTKAFIQVYNQQNEFQISERTLYRKDKAYRERGEAALADTRKQSRRKGETVIPPVIQSIFLQWWLDEARPTVSTCYDTVTKLCILEMPELLPLPNVQSFYRFTEKLDFGLVQFFRYGNKAYLDKCKPYIRRVYDDIYSNDIWSSDYHTLDIFVKDDITGHVFRPHIAVWIDIRSRKILSVVLAENSNSDGVILAFRKAVEIYGIPEKVYLDNGKEYLNSAFGGRGKRKTDLNADYGSTILDRCGTKMYNAAVKNAKAKIIERIFVDVKEEFSKLISTYCGGTPAERPERMKHLTKNLKNVPLLSTVRRQLDLFIEGKFNEHSHSGAGMNGKCPNEVYGDNLIQKRTATKEQLNLMLLRSARLQKVGRNGVHLTFGDTVLDFYSTFLVSEYQEQRVYVRYDIEHLNIVRVYDEKERYICEAELKLTGGYDLGGEANLEAIKQNNRLYKEKKNEMLSKMNEHIERFRAPEMLEVMERAALKRMEEVERDYHAEVLKPVNFEIKTEQVDDVEVNMARMVEAAMQNKIAIEK